ncbi:zf-RING_2 domain-containing protein [Cephalotus follicularis]|uniref:RING-type E3 ubiquitin transferase n=1 Tax=Cephalotus follicularis TaxID=3775 RepID=A0A1Q3BLD2_CEPFO|nr:zf-RING_2 domain-containing protein [Cephalotus follicularis]
MGLPQTPSPPHLYPQALQLKLYQAFIFSIPILFSIILFLLFYLFYLKRRASNNLSSSPPPILPRSSNHSTSYVASPCHKIGSKEELKDELQIVLFDEKLRTRDSQCSVCLGEFEFKEELHQVPLCKHVFHIDCIHHWLCSNSTCPLCRCFIPTNKLHNPPPPPVTDLRQQDTINSNQHQENVSLEQQQQLAGGSSNSANISTEQQMIPVEGSSSATTGLCSRERLPQMSIFVANEAVGSSNAESVVIHIETHNM